MSYNVLVRVALLMVSHTLVVPTEATFSQGFFKTVYLSQASFDAPDTKLGSAKMAKSDWSCRALCLEHNSEHVASGTNLAFVSSNNGVCGGIQ